MPKTSESTIRYKADIADLKAGLQQAKTAIAQANAEFARATEGLDNWRKSSEGVEAKLKQLKSTLSAQTSVLDNYREQLLKTEEQYGQNSIQSEQLRTKIEQQKATIAKTRGEINRYESSLRDVKSAEELAEKEGISLEDALKKVRQSADQAGGSLSDAGDSAEASSGGFTVMKGALASLIADGIKKAIGALKDLALESEKAFDRVQAAIGATNDEFKGYKKELEGLYADNYGESLDDLGQKFAYIKQVTGETDPSKIAELTKNTIALEDTFGSDFNETIRGVNNLITHFGISSEEAFDLFAKGSQEGLDYTSELGDNIAEYGGNFAQAGYSAEEYFELLKNGAEGGAYNLDKVNDSINEIKNRIGDGTIKDNIGQFSSSTGDLFSKWETGKASMKDVIDSIVSDISNCKSEEEALAMAAVAFGTMGEDANLDVVNSLTTLGDTFDDVKGTMEEVDSIRYDNLSSSLDGLGRTIQMQILQPMVEGVTPTLTAGMGHIVEAIQGQISVSELMNIGANWIKSVGEGLAQGIPNLVSSGLTSIEGFTASLRANAPNLIQAGLTLIENLVQGLMNSLPSLITHIPTIVSNIANIINDNAPTILKSGINIIMTIIKGLIKAIPTLIQNIPKIISAIIDVWSAFNWAQLGTKAIKALGNGIKSLGSWLKTIGNNVKDWIVEKIKGLPKTLLNLGKNGIKGLGNGIKAVKSFVTSAIKTIFNAVVNGVKNLPSKLLKIGSDLVKGLWNGISDMTGWVIDKIQGFGESILGGIKDFFGINSPSKVMEEQVGKQLALGVAQGITKNTKHAKQSASELGQAIVEAAEKRLDKYKTYNNMTLAQEVEFWNQIRKEVKKGTNARLEADKNYLSLKKELTSSAKQAELDYTESVSKAYQDLQTNIENVISEYEKEVEARANAISSSMNLFSEFEKNTEASGTQLLASIQSQVSGLQSWIKALDELEAKGIDAGLLGDLRNLGPSSAGEIEALNSMTEAQLNQYVDLWKQKNQLASDAAEKELEGIKTQTIEQIASLVDETQKSLVGYKETYDKALIELGLAVKKNIKDADKTLSKTAATTILKTAPGVGKDMVQGIIDGLNAKSGALYRTISSIISSAIATAQAAAEIQSPSKIMRDLIGKNLIAGINVGMNDESKGLLSNMRSIVSETIATAQSGLRSVRMGLNPMLAGTGGGSSSNMTNLTFYQTINSPKQLSRVDVYRDTKNLLKTAKGAL